MKPILSVVIPARNEYPNIVFTLHSIINCLEADGFTYKDFEVIIVDNGSDDDVYPRRGTKGTLSYLIPRGAYWNRILRVIKDPIFGNHSARNVGAKIASGEYLFFSDAHMSYKPGFFKKMIQTIDESGGLFHGAINWLGAYPPSNSGTGYQYTIKLGEQIKGTWNNRLVDADKWQMITSQGHCSVGVKKKQFLDFGGYPGLFFPEAHLASYGGGEFFLDLKWWAFGSCVTTHPDCIGYHLASERGYSYNYDDYIKNIMAIGYGLDMLDWRERSYFNWLRKGRKEVLDRLMAQTEKSMEREREFFISKRKKTINEILCEQPWDKLNMERLGKKNSAMQIIHWSELELLSQAPEYVKEAYRNSKYQQQLAEFIENNLKQYIYKDKEFEGKYGKEGLTKLRKMLI